MGESVMRQESDRETIGEAVYRSDEFVPSRV